MAKKKRDDDQETKVLVTEQEKGVTRFRWVPEPEADAYGEHPNTVSERYQSMQCQRDGTLPTAPEADPILRNRRYRAMVEKLSSWGFVEDRGDGAPANWIRELRDVFLLADVAMHVEPFSTALRSPSAFVAKLFVFRSKAKSSTAVASTLRDLRRRRTDPSSIRSSIKHRDTGSDRMRLIPHYLAVLGKAEAALLRFEKIMHDVERLPSAP